MNESLDHRKTISQERVLQAFYRALGRESHHLTQSPNLLWQQLHNRLQWEDEPIPKMLTAERENRIFLTLKPWGWIKTPFTDSSASQRIISGLDSDILDCAISPDGTWFVSVDDEPSIRVWDVDLGREQFRLKGHSKKINACAISPDGRWIITGSDDKTLRIWDSTSGALHRILEGHKSGIQAIAVSSDQSFIASCSMYEDELKVWDFLSGSEIRSFEGHSLSRGGYRNHPHDCTISPDGKYILSACADKTLRLFNADSAEEIKTFFGHTNAVLCCAFSPNNRCFVSGGRDKTLRVWDVATGEVLAVLKGHKDSVVDCVFNPDGTKIVSASEDNTLRIWDAKSGKCLSKRLGHGFKVNACDISPDGEWILSSSWDSTLRIWDTYVESNPSSFRGHADGIVGLIFLPDGTELATAGVGETVKFWDREKSTKARKTIKNINTGIFAVDPDGEWVLTAGNRHITLLDVRTKEAILRIKDAEGPYCGIYPDGQWILAANRFEKPRMFNVESGQESDRLSSIYLTLLDCAVSPDGSKILGITKGYKIKIWDSSTGEEIHYIDKDDDELILCRFSPDGRWFITISRQGNLVLHDCEKGVTKQLYDQGYLLNGMVSPGGDFIATTEVDEHLKLWHVQSGLIKIDIPGMGYHHVSFHPWKPMLVCDDLLGGWNLVELFGLEYEPVIVSPIESSGKILVCCPACKKENVINQQNLGKLFNCLNLECNLQMQLTSFTISKDDGVELSGERTLSVNIDINQKIDKDGFGTLIEIPQGSFLMGSSTEDMTRIIQRFGGNPKFKGYTFETPQHIISLPGYWILKTPVTVAQYMAFLKATNYSWKAGDKKQRDKDHPVVHVSLMDALFYCDWLTSKWRSNGMIDYEQVVRLPSEAQWEKAARGPSDQRDGLGKRIFPWGNDTPTVFHCNFGKHVMTLSHSARSFGEVIKSTTPVGAYSPLGDSPYGCVDMAGNVWELTRTIWGEATFSPDFSYPYDASDGREDIDLGDKRRRVVRGGAFHDHEINIRVTFRDSCSPIGYSPYRSDARWFSSVGFRVVVEKLKS